MSDGDGYVQQSSSAKHSGISFITDLSIFVEDSGITAIPLVTLNSMWAKAVELLTSENAITPAPGSNRKACMSYSQVIPHLVQCKLNGQYICDTNCQQWASSQICSHMLAVAEHNKELYSFLEWYTVYAESPNISTLAVSGLPCGRGRKGGRAKRQRKRQQHPSIDNVTVRPGMHSSLFNNIGITCGTVVNMSNATGTAYFQNKDVTNPCNSSLYLSKYILASSSSSSINTTSVIFPSW